MKCQNCSKEMNEDFTYCEACGAPLRPGVSRPYSSSPASGPHKKENTTLLIVVVIIVVVLAVVVAPLALYLMVLGFGGDGEVAPAFMVVGNYQVPGGVRLEFSSPTTPLEWGDIIIQVDDGSDFATWDDFSTADLEGMGATTWTSQNMILGDIFVRLSIVDLTGNGMLNYGDYLTITNPNGDLATGTDYSFRAIYKPTGDLMVTEDFSG